MASRPPLSPYYPSAPGGLLGQGLTPEEEEQLLQEMLALGLEPETAQSAVAVAAEPELPQSDIAAGQRAMRLDALMRDQGLTPEEAEAIIAAEEETVAKGTPPFEVVDDPEPPEELATEPKQEEIKPQEIEVVEDEIEIVSEGGADPIMPTVIDDASPIDRRLLGLAEKRREQLETARSSGNVELPPAAAMYASDLQSAINDPEMFGLTAQQLNEFDQRLAKDIYGSEPTPFLDEETINRVVQIRQSGYRGAIVVSPELLGEATTEEISERPSLGESAVAGSASLVGLTWAGAEAVAEVVGAEDAAKAAGQKRRYYERMREILPEGVPLDEIESIGDALQWASQTLGEQGVLMVAPLSGAVAGRVIAGSIGAKLGAFGPSWMLGTGEVQSGNKQISEDQKAGLATLAGGTAIAALDTILPERVGSALVKALGREQAEEAAQRILLMPANERIIQAAQQVGAGALRGARTEALTEGTQTAVGELATAAETGTPIQPGMLWRVVEASVTGGFMGGVVGGVPGAVEAGAGEATRRAAITELGQAEYQIAPETITRGMSPSQGTVLPQARPIEIVETGEPEQIIEVAPTSAPVDAEGNVETFTIPAGRVTSRFGPRKSFRTANGQQASTNHAGIDIALPQGTPVPAGASGVVTFAGKRGGYGNQVVVTFADGTSASYSHLSRINVKEGDTVAQGAVVGRVGATGNATGPHLHLERRNRQGVPVNPITGREVRTGVTEDGQPVDDTTWETDEEPYEIDEPWPQDEINRSWESKTGQRFAELYPEEEGPETTPQRNVPEPSLPPPSVAPSTTRAAIEALRSSQGEVEGRLAEVRERLDQAKAANPVRIEIERLENERAQQNLSQPMRGEEPVFDEDQSTVVGFVNTSTGNVRAVGAPVEDVATEDFVSAVEPTSATTPQPAAEFPIPSQVETAGIPEEGRPLADMQAIMETLPKSTGAVLGPAREAGQAAVLGLADPQDPSTMTPAAARAYELGVRDAESALQALEQPEAVGQPTEPERAPAPSEAVLDPNLERTLEQIDEKLFDLETDGEKAAARRYVASLVKRGILEKADADALAPIFKDRDMGVEDITSEIRTTVELWADRQRGVPAGRERARLVEPPIAGVGQPAPAQIEVVDDDAGRVGPDGREAGLGGGGRPEGAVGRGSERGEAPLESPPVDDEGNVLLDHFTLQKDLTETDPKQWGRSSKFLPEEERSRIGVAPGRTYFGIGTDRPGGYVNEFRWLNPKTNKAEPMRHPRFGTPVHKVQAKIPLARLYDMAGDPDGLKEIGRAMPKNERGQYIYKDRPVDSVSLYELLIRDAGYAGYWIKRLGMVAAVFEPVQVAPAAEVEAAKPKKQVAEDHPGRAATERRIKARAYKDSVQKQVLNILRQFGAEGIIPVYVVDRLIYPEGEAEGAFDPNENAIKIAAFAVQDVRGTARHEIIHWAVENGVWTAEEWRTLKTWAQSQPGIMAWAREHYRKEWGYSEEDILEEAVAEGFARWDGGQIQPETVISKILQKLKDIIDALRLAFVQAGVSRGELRKAVELLAEFENGKRLAKMRRAQSQVPTFGRRVWTSDLSREMLSGNITPEQHWFLKRQQGEKFQSAWHGSPKDDIAKFSLEYIGQGEGAQAFGWGLYFAQKKDVADWYRRKLTMQTKDPVDIIMEVNGQNIREWVGQRFGQTHQLAAYEVADRVFDYLTSNRPYNGWLDALHARFDNEVDGWVASAKKAENHQEVAELLAEQAKVGDVFRALRGQTVTQKQYSTGGKLYKVEVPENDELIDLDKKLSEQPPKVKKALEKIHAVMEAKEELATHADYFWSQGGAEFVRNTMPNLIYYGFSPENPSEALESAIENGLAGMATSIWLRDVGIPGSRYLDRDSRSGVADGPATANFVIFDDNLIELKAKYRLVDSGVNSPLSDPTIPNPGIFRRIHEGTMAFLGAVGGVDVDRADSLTDMFRRQITQKFLPIQKVQRRAEELLGIERLPGGQNPMEMITADERGYKLGFLTENMVRPMATEMSQRDISTEDLGLYLYARHAPARNARIAKINKEFNDPNDPKKAGSGMSDPEAQQIMADFSAEGKIADLQEVAKHIDAMIEYAQQERLNSGLISAADAAAGFQPGDFYVPLRGNEEIEPELEMSFARAATKGGGFSVAGKESHRMFGRASRADLADIVGYTATQAQEAIDRGYRNRVGQSMMEMFRQAPDPKFVQIDRVKRVATWNRKKGIVEYQMQTRLSPEEQQRTIFVKVDGEVHKMTFSDKNPSAMRFVKAAKNLGIAQLGRFLQITSIFTRLWSKSNTQWNPDFILANATKDIQTGVVNASTLNAKGVRRAMIRNLAKMGPLWGAWWGATHVPGAGAGTGSKWKEYYEEFASHGGKLNYAQVNPIEEAVASVHAEIKHAKRSPLNPLKAVTELGQWIDRANSAFENMTRLALYGALRDMGVPAKQAAQAARELTTNFQQHGEWGPKVNAAYGFANASMIGGARFAYTLSKSPAIAGGLIAVGMLEDFINSMLSDDEWDRYSEEDKHANFFLLLPEQFGFDIKVPAGYGLNAFITVGRKFSELWRGKKKADGTSMGIWDAATDVAYGFVNSFSPITGATFGNIVLPTFADPFWNIHINQNNWGRPVMPEQFGRKEDRGPQAYQAFENTGQFWRMLAETMNVVGGGNEVVPGSPWLDNSPEAYKHVWQETTGGSVRTFNRTIALFQKWYAGENVGPSDIPIVRRFSGNPYGAKDAKGEQMSAFYERLNTGRTTLSYADEMIARFGKDSPQYKEFRRDNAPVLDFAENVQRAAKVNDALNRAKNAAERGEERVTGLTKRDVTSIRKATGIIVPVGKQLTKEQADKIREKAKEKREAMALRFNEDWLKAVMKEE